MDILELRLLGGGDIANMSGPICSKTIVPKDAKAASVKPRGTDPNCSESSRRASYEPSNPTSDYTVPFLVKARDTKVELHTKKSLRGSSVPQSGLKDRC